MFKFLWILIRREDRMMEDGRKNLIRQFFLMNAGAVAVAAVFVLIAFFEFADI